MEINSLKDFIKLMPPNLDTIMEKVRHLYLELGKRSFYDSEYKYFMFGEEEFETIYNYKPYENPNIIICTTLSKQVLELLNMAGISVELVYQGNHCLVNFLDEIGNGHLIDLTNDLKNIQFGCRTPYFGINTINQEELRKIDLKLGYISESRGYTDEYWYVVRDTLKDSGLSDKRKLEIVLQSLTKFGDVTKPRYDGNF